MLTRDQDDATISPLDDLLRNTVQLAYVVPVHPCLLPQ